tara:strand:- start:6994 stop:9360 length:2367 start_codon:yes stop_codon:yes gene_type:complete
MAKILPESFYKVYQEFVDPVAKVVAPGYKPRPTSIDLQPLPEPEPERPAELTQLPPASVQDKTRDFVRNVISKAGVPRDKAQSAARYIVGDINAPLTQGGIGALDFTPAGLLFAGQQAYRDLKEIDPKVDPIYSPILPMADLGLSAVEATVLGKPMVTALKNPAVKEFAKNLSEKLKPTELKGPLSQLSRLNQLNIVPGGPKGALTNLPYQDQEGFYSVVQETIPLIKRGKGTGQDFVNEMRSQAVKQGYPVKSFNNEIKAMDLNLDSEFTKEKFAQHLNDKRFTVNVVENRDIDEIEDRNQLEFDLDRGKPGETAIMIHGEHVLTMVRDPDSSNPMQRKYYIKTTDGEQLTDFTASTLAEAGVQARMFLDRKGYTDGAASTGLKWMDEHALSDLVEIDEEEYMMPPQQNRREFLITSPEVGEFKKGHFNKPKDTVVASVMASDWNAPVKTADDSISPNATILYGDELQSDHAMANSRRQQRTKIMEGDVFPLLDDLEYLAEAFEMLGVDARHHSNYRKGILYAAKKIKNASMAESNPSAPYYTAMFADDVSDAITHMIRSLNEIVLSGDQIDEVLKNPRLKSIIYGDSKLTPDSYDHRTFPTLVGSADYTNKNSLAEKLSSAAAKLTQIGSVHTKPNSDVPNPWQDTWHELALKKLMRQAVDEGYTYVMVPKSETLVTKWSPGPATKEAPQGAYRKMYQTVYDRKIPSVLQKYAKKYNSELTDGEIGRADFGDEPGMDESNLPVTLIRITPEMKKAVKQGQPLFNIAVGTAAGAGALSTLDQEEPAQ